MSDNNMIEAQISVVLTDIIASTKFVEKYGAHKAAHWFSAHDKMVLSYITLHNGQWIDNSDGHLMYFASVSDAIAFACDYKKALIRHKFPFASRVGIHWDKMIILKTEKKLIDGGVKRINLEGLGKNKAARTMSICGPAQILLTNNAYQRFKNRTTDNKHIPKKIQVAPLGMYKFKGVSQLEKVWVLAFREKDLQPLPDSEKAIRIGNKKKIKTHFRNKFLIEKLVWISYRLFFISLVYILSILWPFLSNKDAKEMWNLDYWFFVPIEYLDLLFDWIKSFL